MNTYIFKRVSIVLQRYYSCYKVVKALITKTGRHCDFQVEINTFRDEKHDQNFERKLKIQKDRSVTDISEVARNISLDVAKVIKITIIIIYNNNNKK
ncbi:hypothetical protein Avbf_09878 [Armadillidium vulgare]|nr:hypothetical protein Avbf_09878 [Armadillidium vulgare]